ncbi:hypothetical protein ACSQ67_011607 [Phaseolus vulgaris]
MDFLVLISMKSCEEYGNIQVIYEVMVPDLDLTLPMNGGNGSTIPSTIIDESASTRTNFSFTPSSTKPTPLPFPNHCPVRNLQAFGVLTGMLYSSM